MIQLRYLKEAKLFKATRTKQDNGAYIETLTLTKTYKVMRAEINDEVSASIYGASIERMFRLSSPKQTMENYLQTLVDPVTNNISDYYIVMDSRKYKINSVKLHWVDVEMVGMFNNPSV